MHPIWADDPAEALALQARLRRRVVARGAPAPALVAGLDAAYSRDGATIYGAAVLFLFPGLEQVGEAWTECEARFPYIPGLFAFREGPALCAALEALDRTPDLILVHGHGIAHPRRCGIASHLGVLLGTPSIGVADLLLVGEAGEPRGERGAAAPVRFEGEVVGWAVRTRTGARPIYVSPGHLVGHAAAVELVLAMTGNYRRPEPLRAAHRCAVSVRAGKTKR
ncbi:endonuclease V [Methanofollis aquaemaris]|uniref:Endonuclease V n=1 Tax=Methanofollis aquaemaris TaxID=126734 RepID=A0A8A3S3F9_9EURY|nr:endonuclease V [Methanofollis aquaemaris]QSZ66807.1 endonuclease V [Methanofollis aquaemaris]